MQALARVAPYMISSLDSIISGYCPLIWIPYGGIVINKNEVFFSKYDQIYRNLQILLHLLEKSLMKNFIFWVVIKLHERSLRIIYFDKSASNEEPAARYGSVSLHYKALYIFATEMFKVFKTFLLKGIQEWTSKIKNGPSKTCGRQPLKTLK